MATLNLNEKKIPSAENLRLIAQLCISLANKQSSLEDRCIAPWRSGEVYQKDISYVSYNNYLYFCTVSNSDTDFVESHWTKLSDTISELTKADIEALVNLTPEQITNLQSLIDDTSISTTHTNSSSHIYMAIQDAIAECKDDTLKQIAKKVSGSYKIANTTADIVSADYIYLLSNGSNYDLYVLVDGTATKVGDTNIDLSEYVKTTDLADYMKTSDADGKFATITTVDDKVDKSNIATSLDDTVTDEQVTSALLAKTELDKLSTKLNGLINDTKVTTINTFSSDKIKAITNEIRKFTLSKTDYQGVEAYPTECGVYRVIKKIDGTPKDASQYASLIIYGNGYFTHIYHDVVSERIWLGYTDDSVKAPTWQEIATMDKVKDGYAKIIKNGDTDTDDAMFIAYKNNNLFGIRIYKNDNSEHELRFSESGISYVKNGVTIWTK